MLWLGDVWSVCRQRLEGWRGRERGREEGRVLTGLRVVESARVGDGCGWKMEEGRKEGRKEASGYAGQGGE